MRSELAEAHQEVAVAKEAAKAVDDAAKIAANIAQDGSLQASFKVLRQALVQVAPSFDIKALDVLVTLEMVDIVMVEVEADLEAEQVVAGRKGSTSLVDAQATGETDAAEVLSAEAQMAPSEEDAIEAPTEDEADEVVPAGEAEVAKAL